MNSLDILPIELWNEIGNKLNFQDTIKFRKICKLFYDKIQPKLTRYAIDLIKLINSNDYYNNKYAILIFGNMNIIGKVLEFIKYYFKNNYGELSLREYENDEDNLHNVDFKHIVVISYNINKPSSILLELLDRMTEDSDLFTSYMAGPLSDEYTPILKINNKFLDLQDNDLYNADKYKFVNYK